jgi:tRNA (cytosine49-C5)-methyltransferase
MSKSKPDKTELKREAWVSRTMLALNISDVEARQLLSIPRKQSVRINTLRTDADIVFPGKGTQYPWITEGFICKDTTALRDSKIVNEGVLFIQNAASWLPVVALDPLPEDVILDVCAAPGGKTSHIAAKTGNKAHIWANDNSRARLAKLRANMERLGAHADQYTLYDATAIARKLSGHQFDKILLDAPCSGEGLMNLNNTKDFATWSVAHIKRLQQLQKRLITQAWHLLKPGGLLVYSTCTMAPEENEAVIDYILRAQDDVELVPIEIKMPNRVPAVTDWNNKHFSAHIQGCMRLIPSENIEAFFVCKLKKVAS